MKQIFDTKEYKVKIVVYDFTTDETPVAMRKERPAFSVCVMKHGLNPKTAFSAAGTVIAHTDNPIEALAALKEAAPSFTTQLLKPGIRELVDKWKY